MALDASDGRLRWRRNLGNVSPQGYLVDAGADLIVPNGRAEPRLHRKSDGAFRRELSRSTGTLVVVSGTESFSGPGATGTLARGDFQAGVKVVSFPGRQLAVTPKTSLLLNEREVQALDRSAMRAAGGDPGAAVVWKRALEGGTAVIVAGQRVYVGTAREVVAIRLDTGAVDQSLPVEAPVVALAADGAALIAALADGRIRAFRPVGAAAAAPAEVRRVPPLSTGRPTLPEGVAEGLARLSSGPGWGLSLRDSGAAGARVRAALVEGSGLRWTFAVEASEAETVRGELADRGWLGSRASVVVRQPGGPIAVADHLFNLVLAEGRDRVEALRLACPSLRGPGDRRPGDGGGPRSHGRYLDASVRHARQHLRHRPVHARFAPPAVVRWPWPGADARPAHPGPCAAGGRRSRGLGGRGRVDRHRCPQRHGPLVDRVARGDALRHALRRRLPGAGR